MVDRHIDDKKPERSSVDHKSVRPATSGNSHDVNSILQTDPLSEKEVHRLAESFLESCESWIDTCKKVWGDRVAQREVDQFVRSLLESHENGILTRERLWGRRDGGGRTIDAQLTARPGDTTCPELQAEAHSSTSRPASSQIPIAENIYPLGDRPPDSFLQFIADRLSPEGLTEFRLIQIRTAMAAIEDQLNTRSTVPPTSGTNVRRTLGLSLESLFQREAKMIHLKGKALSDSDAAHSQSGTGHCGPEASPRSVRATAQRRKPPATGKRR